MPDNMKSYIEFYIFYILNTFTFRIADSFVNKQHTKE